MLAEPINQGITCISSCVWIIHFQLLADPIFIHWTPVPHIFSSWNQYRIEIAHLGVLYLSVGAAMRKGLHRFLIKQRLLSSPQVRLIFFITSVWLQRGGLVSSKRSRHGEWEKDREVPEQLLRQENKGGWDTREKRQDRQDKSYWFIKTGSRWHLRWRVGVKLVHVSEAWVHLRECDNLIDGFVLHSLGL